MKRTILSALSVLLALIMLLGILSSCARASNTGKESDANTQDTTNQGNTEDTVNESDGSESKSATSDSEIESDGSESESATADSEIESTGSESESATDDSEIENTGSESEHATSNTETETKNESENVVPSEHDALIQTSNGLAGGVQAYFTDASRAYYTIKNQEMALNYGRANYTSQLVESIKNTKGVAYIQNTMDIFVRMKDGKHTFYASNSSKSAEANLYRLGYYYYEALFEYQNFVLDEIDTEISQSINLKRQLTSPYGIKLSFDSETGAASFIITDPSDPRFTYSKDFDYDTENCTTLILKAKTVGTLNGVCLYIDTGSGFSENQTVDFSVVNDGEYHTYYIYLGNVSGYTGKLKGLRFDPAGGVGDGLTVESISLGKGDVGEIPDALSINRHFHIYSDKMHHAVQFAVTEKTENIAEVGMITRIGKDTVSKLIVVTDDGNTYDSLDEGFDWNRVAAIGFDVKDAGIFGYILPVDDIAGKIRVELIDGEYVIEQTRTPSANGVDGVILPSINTEKKDGNGHYIHADGVTNNGNDLYLGQRIYTDESHDFAEFLLETYFERNPLDERRIIISESTSDKAYYAGYDAMRGIYVLKVATPGGFATPYYDEPSKDYKVNFIIRSDADRGIYVMTSGVGGNLECATLMDKDMMLLPVPVEVLKNFSEPMGERNLFNISDSPFSEAIVYIPLEQDKKQEYTIINIYQNWGKYPLKQISGISYQMPYYHLSTGVIETNCILPWFQTDVAFKKHGNLLPDFRSMSAPLWAGQPQHNSCGVHTWLTYSDENGKEIYVESVNNTITSYGPTYAEIAWENLSDDGKIKVTYTHMEMPQTDENRTYYTMEYEFLEDLTINNFKDNFRFYNVFDNDAKGSYKKLGYLNKNNECVVADSNLDASTVTEYVLGDMCPYFSLFMMPDWDRESTGAEGYSNVAFLIYNSKFTVGGEEKDYSFLIKNTNSSVSLTLNIADTVSFKTGDKITINAILMPWGSQELEDDPANRLNKSHTNGYTEYTYSTVLEDGSLYMDKNVRDVRENTLLNPLTLTSETDTVIESTYLPKIKSLNGKSAEFTLLGGENNVTVRAYGFYKLTAPKIEELVDGEWREYVLSSHETPDKKGNYHYYDGYMVHYDEDGTYSYSFVTTMYDGAPRTFRIFADTDFAGWPKEEKPIVQETPLLVYVDPEKMKDIILESEFFGNAILAEDENSGAYTSAYVKLNNPYNESYATFYTPATLFDISGQYLVIKYRVPKTNKEGIRNLEIFASTGPSNAFNSGSFGHTLTSDGEWHVDVIDLSKSALKQFAPNESGNYCASFLRIDVFNGPFTDEDTHIDFAYIGMESDLAKICELEKDNFEYLYYYEGAKLSLLEVATSTVKSPSDTYIDPSSGYERSEEAYGAMLDYVGGNRVSLTSNTPIGEPVVHYGTTVSENGKLELAGWCCVNGGIEEYVFSADGGKTWKKCTGSPLVATDEIVSVAQDYSETTFDDIEASKTNGRFQGSARINLDLSEYAGKTVDVVFAAVPKLNTQSLVLLFCFEDVVYNSASVNGDVG